MDLEKKEYVPIEVEDVKEISSTQREKMLQKSAKYLPDNPADSGMRASAVKPKFYGFVTDSSDSMMAYHNETVKVLNERLKAIKEKVNLEFGQNATDINDIIDEITLIYKALEVEVANRNAAIEQAISNLVNNSPEALDTLHELAQALGNDPNFATTILNVINEKYISAKQYTDSTVESEASERQSQDNVVLSNAKSYTNTKISEEVSNRNITIENAISQEVANRNSAITDEISARQTADNALSQRIDNILGTEGDISTIEGAYDKACQYADTLVSNLINNSPSALDTLKEIAEALGNDPNFATTVINLINSKYSDVAGKIPTNLSQLNSDSSHRLVSDTEKKAWNEKVNKSGDTMTGELKLLNDQYARGYFQLRKDNPIPSELKSGFYDGLFSNYSKYFIVGEGVDKLAIGYEYGKGLMIKVSNNNSWNEVNLALLDSFGNILEKGTRVFSSNNLPNKVKDISNNAEITFAYSKDGVSVNSILWLAAWNGYELRAISKNDLLDYRLLKNKPNIYVHTILIEANDFRTSIVIVVIDSVLSYSTFRDFYDYNDGNYFQASGAEDPRENNMSIVGFELDMQAVIHYADGGSNRFSIEYISHFEELDNHKII